MTATLRPWQKSRRSFLAHGHGDFARVLNRQLRVVLLSIGIDELGREVCVALQRGLGFGSCAVCRKRGREGGGNGVVGYLAAMSVGAGVIGVVLVVVGSSFSLREVASISNGSNDAIAT